MKEKDKLFVSMLIVLTITIFTIEFLDFTTLLFASIVMAFVFYFVLLDKAQKSKHKYHILTFVMITSVVLATYAGFETVKNSHGGNIFETQVSVDSSSSLDGFKSDNNLIRFPCYETEMINTETPLNISISLSLNEKEKNSIKHLILLVLSCVGGSYEIIDASTFSLNPNARVSVSIDVPKNSKLIFEIGAILSEDSDLIFIDTVISFNSTYDIKFSNYKLTSNKIFSGDLSQIVFSGEFSKKKLLKKFKLDLDIDNFTLIEEEELSDFLMIPEGESLDNFIVDNWLEIAPLIDYNPLIEPFLEDDSLKIDLYVLMLFYKLTGTNNIYLQEVKPLDVLTGGQLINTAAFILLLAYLFILALGFVWQKLDIVSAMVIIYVVIGIILLLWYISYSLNDDATAIGLPSFFNMDWPGGLNVLRDIMIIVLAVFQWFFSIGMVLALMLIMTFAFGKLFGFSQAAQSMLQDLKIRELESRTKRR